MDDLDKKLEQEGQDIFWKSILIQVVAFILVLSAIAFHNPLHWYQILGLGIVYTLPIFWTWLSGRNKD